MSYRQNLWLRHLPMVSKMIRRAIAQGRNLGPTMYARALELGTKAALHGACFLTSSDATSGASCYAYIAHLEMADLGYVAWVAGALATLIAAAVRMDRRQGGVSGKALIVAFGEDARQEAGKVWVMENPRRSRKAA